ncbi:hypothetical protein MHK_002984 [Candidatus Magnetomorum sp. HK-1]|nr:hypothetical protein MHK_002984 [Candidatus Magnetomorum sp. HK-1]
MSENECRGEPCVRPRTKTEINPMSENECRGEPCVRPRTEAQFFSGKLYKKIGKQSVADHEKKKWSDSLNI